MTSIYLVYPEQCWVSDDKITGWYVDAVADGLVQNKHCTTIDDMAAALEDAGFITRGRADNSPIGEFWLAMKSINQMVLPAKDNANSYDNGLRAYRCSRTSMTLQIRKSTDKQKRLLSVDINRQQAFELGRYLTEVAETLEDE